MTFNASIRIDNDVLEAIEDTARTLPTLMETAVEREAQRIRKAGLERLRAEPGKPKYPIRWASDRQRRYVMWKLRRDGNQPYRRTGDFVQAWDIRFLPESGEIVASNDSGIEQYVTGRNQQPFHNDTGWYKSREVLADIANDAEERLTVIWFTITDPVIP